MPNIELLNKAIALVEANPKHWNQEEMWHCEDTHCLAGIIQLMVHDLPISTNFNEKSFGDNENVFDKDTFELAIKHLNIDYKTGRVLFHWCNTLETIKALSKILEREGKLIVDDNEENTF